MNCITPSRQGVATLPCVTQKDKTVHRSIRVRPRKKRCLGWLTCGQTQHTTYASLGFINQRHSSEFLLQHQLFSRRNEREDRANNRVPHQAAREHHELAQPEECVGEKLRRRFKRLIPDGCAAYHSNDTMHQENDSRPFIQNNAGPTAAKARRLTDGETASKHNTYMQRFFRATTSGPLFVDGGTHACMHNTHTHITARTTLPDWCR